MFVPIGGIGTVTKNMYLYIYGNEILIVDCGIGFADETTPGVDFLIPDISYLKTALNEGKRIVGMVLTHGHEDHIGGLPFVLPSLPKFPIYASSLAASLSNEKLHDFGIKNSVQIANFSETLKLGSFSVSLVRMTHSIIDAGNLYIKTPIGNFYHAADFKFDFTPVDGKASELHKIAQAGMEGIIALFSDCLGSERPGHSPSEMKIYDSFENEFGKAQGKIFVTTYSSNISRLNQAIEVAVKQGRKVCFMGRSLLKARDIGRELAYVKYPANMEIKPQDVKLYKPSQVLILIAGSQAQEGSALMRVTSGDDRDIRIESGDMVIFSADPIPGNEVNINSLIDDLSEKGARVIYSDITDEFHVSGHGSQTDLQLMIALTKPQFILPIGGTYKHMSAYREIARGMGYADNKTILIDSGQSIIFKKDSYTLGKKINLKNIYVDEVTGEEVEQFIVRDRMKISKEGILVVIVEVDSASGQIASAPDVISRGFIYQRDKLIKQIDIVLRKSLTGKPGRANIGHLRKLIQDKVESMLYREGREPFVVPVIIEV